MYLQIINNSFFQRVFSVINLLFRSSLLSVLSRQVVFFKQIEAFVITDFCILDSRRFVIHRILCNRRRQKKISLYRYSFAKWNGKCSWSQTHITEANVATICADTLAHKMHLMFIHVCASLLFEYMYLFCSYPFCTNSNISLST